MPEISVIIPAYNTAPLIERAIISVLAQKDVPEFEVIVVDDCSIDNTVEVVQILRAKDSRIRILLQHENQGPAAARNRGLREAHGKYIAFLDGDDYWSLEFLKETFSFFIEYPDAVAVSVMQCHKIIGKESFVVPQNTGLKKPMLLNDFFEFWSQYNHVCTGSVLFRKDIAMAIGGQREDLRICEDLEFWGMLATYGKWGFIPKVLFTSDGGIVTKQQGWLEKNMRRWKSAPSVDEWRKRIDARKHNVSSVFLEKAIGIIARNLCYSHIMIGKDCYARQEVVKYGEYFPKNSVNIIFNIMAKFSVLWKIWCRVLRHRELHRTL